MGALLAVPAIRLSGLYLALATLGFGIFLEYVFYSEKYMFGSNGEGLIVPRPDVSWISATDKGFYYLVLAVAVVVSVLVVCLNRSRLGRLLRAISESPRGLATVGTSINITQVLVFCLSAFLAAIAGALGGGVVGVVTAGSYDPLLSVTFFAVIMLSVGGEPWYALLAAAAVTLIPSYIPGANVNNYLTLLFGVGAVLYAVTPAEQRGVPVRIQTVMDRYFRANRGRSPSIPDGVSVYA